MVGYYLREPTQRYTADHSAGYLRLLMFVVEDQQRFKTRAAHKVQVAEIDNQWSPQPRKPADRLGYQVGVGCVDFAIDTQDSGQSPRMDMQLRSGAIDLVAAAWLPKRL